MSKLKFFGLYLIILFIIFLIFKPWFSLSPLSSGDWAYKFPQQILSMVKFPFVWDNNLVYGMGGNITFLVALNTYFTLTTWFLFSILHIPWVLIEKIVWFWPFLIISILSSFYFFKKHIIDNNILSLISSLVFTTNTYILMLVGGGQIGIGISYALMPLVVDRFLKITENKTWRNSIFAGLIFSIQLLFDLRIAYITLSMITIFYVFNLPRKGFWKELKYSFVPFFVLPGVVTFLLHFFWIIPLILVGQNPLQMLGKAYSGQDIVSFLSFAKFENTISLLHPNWPENIFGKVGFMKPEFLVLPILAFASLLFISKTKEQKTKSYILFFALLALIGAFLAKGANEPFGEVYIWLFNHFPLFQMFRDSTKWYSIIAFSFSLLIPFTLFEVSKLNFLKRLKKYAFPLTIFIFLIFWCFTIREAILGELNGTFKKGQIPSSYISMANFLGSQNGFYRILWIPTTQQYSYLTQNHPAVPAQDYFSIYDSRGLINKISKNEKLLQELSIKYVIVPFDSEGRIFVTDRKYDDLLYKKTVTDLEKIAFLKKKKAFGKIAVFEVLNPKDHFYISNQQSEIRNQKITYKYVSPVEYKLEVKNVKKGDVLVFSENYDVGWVIQSTKFKVQSTRYDGRFNSFILPQDGDYSLRVYYTPQDYVNLGVAISGLSLMLVLGTLVYLRKKKI